MKIRKRWKIGFNFVGTNELKKNMKIVGCRYVLMSIIKNYFSIFCSFLFFPLLPFPQERENLAMK